MKVNRSLRGEDVIKSAQAHDLRVRECSGSHVMIYAPDGEPMTCYHGQLSTGVACKVRKWFLRLGILLTLAFALYQIL